MLIQSPHDFSEYIVVMDDLPDHMDHVTSLVIFISSFGTEVHPVKLNDGGFILYGLAGSDTIGIPGIFPEEKSGIQCFTIIGEGFMDPFVGDVFAGNIVSKPFMTALMYYNKIPFQSPAGSGKIFTIIAFTEAIAISNITLVFHAQVGGLHQFIPVFIKRISAKPVFKTTQHGIHAVEMYLGYL